MKPNDAQLRDRLIEVLDRFDVQYDDIMRGGVPCLKFRAGLREVSFSYASADEAPHAPRKLERILRLGGIRPKQLDLPDRPAKHHPNRLTLHNASNLRLKRTDQAMPEAPLPASPSETPQAKIEQPEIDHSRMPAPVFPGDVPETRSEQPATVSDLEAQYVPSRLVIIRSQGEHLITSGDYLIIPLHAPETFRVVSPADYEEKWAMMFRPVVAEPIRPVQREIVATPPERPVDAVSPSPPLPFKEVAQTAPEPSESVIEPLSAEPPPVAAETVEPPPPESGSPDTVETTMSAGEGGSLEAATFDLGASDAGPQAEDTGAGLIEEAPPAPLSEPMLAPEPPDTRPRKRYETGKIQVDNVEMSYQLGRIITAIWQASQVLGKTEVTTAEASEWMNAKDARQVYRRISVAVDANWVTLSKDEFERYLLTITPQGERIVRAVAYISYFNVGFAVPDYVAALKDEAPEGAIMQPGA